MIKTLSGMTMEEYFVSKICQQFLRMHNMRSIITGLWRVCDWIGPGIMGQVNCNFGKKRRTCLWVWQSSTSTLSCLNRGMNVFDGLIATSPTQIPSKILRANQDCCTDLIRDLRQWRPKSLTRRNQIFSDDQPHLIMETGFRVTIHFSCPSEAMWLCLTDRDLRQFRGWRPRMTVSRRTAVYCAFSDKNAGTTTSCPRRPRNVCSKKKYQWLIMIVGSRTTSYTLICYLKRRISSGCELK